MTDFNKCYLTIYSLWTKIFVHKDFVTLRLQNILCYFHQYMIVYVTCYMTYHPPPHINFSPKIITDFYLHPGDWRGGSVREALSRSGLGVLLKDSWTGLETRPYMNRTLTITTTPLVPLHFNWVTVCGLFGHVHLIQKQTVLEGLVMSFFV